jgi:cytochrome bd-type quinol oxidase subunit 2
MQFITRALASLIVVFGLTGAATVSVSAQDINKNLECGANLVFTNPEEGCATDGSGNTAAERVDQIVEQIINIMSLVVGVVAVIMIIIGGLRYITSGGDSGNVTNAKNTILYAVVGLVVVALAQVIVRFVVNRATLAGTNPTAGD